MNNENLNFKIKHPIAFGCISVLIYLFSEIILSALLYLIIFCFEAYGRIKIGFNESLIDDIVSILCCFLYVCLNRFVYIYKIKSLKKMFKNTYIICLIYLILLLLIIIGLIEEKTSFKKGLEILPGFIKIFGIAFVEETLFRGIFCRFIALKYGKNEKGIFLAVILSSGFFGLAHTINLLSGIPLNAIIQQSVFAFAVGCFFAGMYLKSGNIWEPIIIHFVIDFTSLFPVYFTNSNQTFKTTVSDMGKTPIAVSLLRCGIILLLSYIIYLRKSKIKNLVSNVELMKEYELKHIKK